MDRGAQPTPALAGAHRYAATVRILAAALGIALLIAEPAIFPSPAAAAVGLALIGLAGIVEWGVSGRRPPLLDQVLTCAAAVAIIGWSGGEVNVIELLWLVAATAGVLARGGRVGWAAPAVVVLTLFSPLVTEGGMSAANLGFAAGAILLLLAAGRISRETVRLLDRARHDAARDSLTGALSPGELRDRIDSIAALATEGQPAALIAIEIDDFGAVKRFGNAAADRLLSGAAAAMSVRLSDHDLLGRIGGDQFAAFVLCDDAEPVAGRLLAALQSQGASGCAGIAVAPRDGTDAEALLGAADVALRLTKRHGTTPVGLYDGVPITSDPAVGAQAALERLCRGEGLSMAVQPIVDVEAATVHAFESLARFATRDGHGPVHWFALADELGMRAELELACLRKGLELLPDLPADSRLTVNLSALMLVDERTAELLAGQPEISRLVVEVTEETLIRHAPLVERTIDALRGRGAHFAVDDVGAGYSGLSRLAVLRPTYVKLDRGLVRGIDSDPARMALVRALAEYARDTDAMVVAEGVETRKELARVRDAGASLVQGYLLARPQEPWPGFDADPLGLEPLALVG
ncbi:MAG: bifunctional diguanylate cyclase/phosphodiesterase [Solirubrobacterales bacterium]